MTKIVVLAGLVLVLGTTILQAEGRTFEDAPLAPSKPDNVAFSSEKSLNFWPKLSKNSASATPPTPARGNESTEATFPNIHPDAFDNSEVIKQFQDPMDIISQ